MAGIEALTAQEKIEKIEKLENEVDALHKQIRFYRVSCENANEKNIRNKVIIDLVTKELVRLLEKVEADASN